ncbi:DNA segregation ATPase FtsK/SpoIIIE, S-DNA-T family [Amycolatopsis arida]|uniref:DNA segregation ATPase FtsK/SpoIIIE, S-DNA-T family n=1 Tax=Amycolatopsis arida TaxID=587909 RepID=A0A1I5ZDQ3_9PSEU|nr:hypothetical protein CLV69_10975 [Amycolatopsis arida]SFQ54533.1 DNA segregation ATPase FtsK/SpoIIIE, S-DNA-T family [Amycolatopsis arida]
MLEQKIRERRQTYEEFAEAAVGRGAVLAGREWRRWVRVHDYREAAEQSEKLADKFIEIRALTLFRWKATGLVLVGLLVVLAVAYLVYGPVAM